MPRSWKSRVPVTGHNGPVTGTFYLLYIIYTFLIVKADAVQIMVFAVVGTLGIISFDVPENMLSPTPASPNLV